MLQTSPDLNFGVLKKKLKRTEANCLKDLASAVQESSVTNNAKLCGLEDGIEAIPMYAGKEFLKDGLPIIKITKQRYMQYFEICASAPGKVTTPRKVSDECGTVAETNRQVVF